MIREGETAPPFSLPAAVDGGIEEIALDDYRGQVAVLAFYPADFNPACDGETTGLDDLDVFTMQKDVAVLGISGDSVYSHLAFADAYDLRIPLLADVDGEVAAAYGLAAEGGEYPTERAVVAVGPEGVVQYAWRAGGLTGSVDIGRMREAVDGIGGDATAEARYRVGHARYVEGRRAFTSAMGELKGREWIMAQNDFGQAESEFEEAASQFDTAARFAESDHSRTHYERAEEKARALSQAADWLAGSASAFASGEGSEGEQLRADAEAPLSTARDIDEPVPPDDFPPEPGESAGPESGGAGASLDAGFDADTGDRDDGRDGDETPEPTPAADAGADGEPDGESGGDGTERIDDAELAEITAEVEEQTVPGVEDLDDGSEDAADGAVDPDGELGLTDPTEEADGEGDAADGEDEEATGDGNTDGDDRCAPDST
jgi:peroxiredoxin